MSWHSSFQSWTSSMTWLTKLFNDLVRHKRFSKYAHVMCPLHWPPRLRCNSVLKFYRSTVFLCVSSSLPRVRTRHIFLVIFITVFYFWILPILNPPTKRSDDFFTIFSVFSLTRFALWKTRVMQEDEFRCSGCWEARYIDFVSPPRNTIKRSWNRKLRGSIHCSKVATFRTVLNPDRGLDKASIPLLVIFYSATSSFFIASIISTSYCRSWFLARTLNDFLYP